MDLRDFTVADLDRLAQLLERKEKLTAEMAEVDAALADFRPGHAAQSGTAPAPGPGPGPGPRPKTEPPKKRQQRGKFKELILAELKTAGREGLSVSELAEKLGTDPKRVHSWYYSVGRKLPNLIKAGRGRIAWQEGEPTGTESPDRSL